MAKDLEASGRPDYVVSSRRGSDEGLVMEGVRIESRRH
jgi:hypothetical protein